MYCKKLEHLRNSVIEKITELQSTTDPIIFYDHDDTEDMSDVPVVNIRHKYGLYSTEYVARLKNIGGEVIAETICQEDGSKFEYPITTFSTGELCMIADSIINLQQQTR